MTKKVAYFRNGVLYNLSARNAAVSLYEDRQVAYDADTVIVSDREIYDPEQPESIAALSVPSFDKEGGGVVFDLSYILKMRCSMVSDASAIPNFVKKTLEMMVASPIAWRRGDYLRVICNYYANGLFEEGDRFEAQYRASHKALFSDPLDDTQEAEHLSTKYYFEDKWRRHNEYAELKALLPDMMPATVKGYLQIRTRQTKRFLEIKQAAENKGYVFHLEPFHYCRKHGLCVAINQEYDHSGRYDVLKSVQCERCLEGKCKGKDEFGLCCVYPCRQRFWSKIWPL